MTKLVEKFLRDERGNYATITAIALIPIMAGVAGAIDLTNRQTHANNVHNALDAAGIAIATKVGSGMTDAELEELGEAVFEANVDSIISFNAEFDYPGAERPVNPDTGEEDGDTYITVTANYTYQSLYSFGSDTVVGKESEITIAPSDPACVMALSSWEDNSVYIKGDADLDLDGCSIASMSTSDSSIKRQGSAEIKTGCIWTQGDTEGIMESDGSKNSNVDMKCSSPRAGTKPTNPLADYTAPAAGACEKNKDYEAGKSGGVTTYNLVAGKTYCSSFNGAEINLTTGGTYIFDGADISLSNDKHKLVGTGVTLVFLDGASLNATGGLVSLTAPTDKTDPYAGIVIFSGSGNTSNFEIGGNTEVDLTGFVYIPDGDFTMGGTPATAGGKCLRILANTVELSGNAAMKADCTDELGGIETYAGSIIRIKR